LVIVPYLRRGRAAGEGVLGLAPGDRFLFRATGNARDMARLAALGLLPGVPVTVLRMPRRGPVVLSARNTRIAVARNVAAAFILERAEA
jgi:Fe2+ transport system protein FeoA